MLEKDDLILAIDIGGSKFIVGLVSTSGEVLTSERREWEGITPERFIAQLKSGIDDLRVSYPEEFSRVVVGGVTVPGFCDPIEGSIVDTDFLKIKDYPLCQELKACYGIDFYADNDCKAAALAEQMFGSAQDGSIFYVTISTGVGGTHVLDNGVVYGAFGHAGEVGLVIADRSGFASDQGLPGVLEAHACGRGLVKNYVLAGGQEEVDGVAVDGRMLANLARAGDKPAQAALDMEGRLLARALAPLCEAVEVDRVVLGGGMSLQFDTFGPSLKEEFSRLCHLPIIFEPTSLGYLGAFLGAAALGIRGHTGQLPNLGKFSNDYLKVSLAGNTLKLEPCVNGQLRAHKDATVSNLGNFLLAENVSDSGQTLASSLRALLDEALAPTEISGSLERDFATLVTQTRSAQTDASRALTQINATGVLAQISYSIGRALAALATVFDPNSIVLTGVLGEAWDVMQDNLRQALIDETYYRGNLPFDVLADIS